MLPRVNGVLVLWSACACACCVH